MYQQMISTRLKHRIVFLQNIADSEIEQPIWQEKIYTFAEVKAICDHQFLETEGIKFGHLITEGYFHFVIRYLNSITTEMRILFEGRNFDIKRVVDLGTTSKLLRIIALEIV